MDRVGRGESKKILSTGKQTSGKWPSRPKKVEFYTSSGQDFRFTNKHFPEA